MAKEEGGVLVFPENFEWGTATAAFQIEGGASDRGRCIWDTFCEEPGRVENGDHGLVACDHYNRYEDDVALLAKFGFKNYRFSISWPRLFPSGRVQDGVDEKGKMFYDRLINCLVQNGIKPVVTLYHWDLPSALEAEIGGWLSPKIPVLFSEYADQCFAMFGDRVKTWLTLNEPWCCAVLGYCTGDHAPGFSANPGTDVYTAAHHLLLSHARAVRVYREKYQHAQHGRIGLTLNTNWWEPYSNDPLDIAMAKRAMDFNLGWFADPIYFGDYPDIMKEVVGERLPRFSAEEQALLRGSADFFGLNNYTSTFAGYSTVTRQLKNAITALRIQPSGIKGAKMAWDMMMSQSHYFKDTGGMIGIRDDDGTTDMGWPIAPWGVRKLLEYIQQKYVPAGGIYLFENGMAVKELSVREAAMDTQRINFVHSYLVEIHQAMRNGADLRGYFYWSFLDNFEWAFGYGKRFGLVYVDYQTQKRTPKASAYWYRDVIEANGLAKKNGGKVGEEFIGILQTRGQLEWAQSCREEERKVAHSHGLLSHRMLVFLMLILSFFCYSILM